MGCSSSNAFFAWTLASVARPRPLEGLEIRLMGLAEELAPLRRDCPDRSLESGLHRRERGARSRRGFGLEEQAQGASTRRGSGMLSASGSKAERIRRGTTCQREFAASLKDVGSQPLVMQ